MNQKNFDDRDYSYVFCTKKRLELKLPTPKRTMKP